MTRQAPVDLPTTIALGAVWKRLKSLRNPSCLAVHGVALAALGLAWVLDEPLYRLMNGWYNRPEPINGELHQLIVSLAMYGQVLGISLSILLILLMDTRRRGRALVLGAVLVAAGLGCDLLKAGFGRVRPVMAEGKTVFHGPRKGIVASRNQSFPSGHTAVAFALSYTLARFYPQAHGLVWILAYGVGINRVITVRHFLTDVIAGAWLGYSMAVLVMHAGWLSRLGDRLSRLLSPDALRPARRWRWTIPSAEVRRSLASPALLLMASLIIHWSGNDATALWDRDEPRFATATREMAERGDWIVPTFNGDLRPDKPILIYWLMGGAYAMFGDGPFAARFFSGLAGSLACLVTYLLGRAMFGKRTGLLAGWMLALSPMLIAESKLATADAVLLLCLTGAFGCAWRLISTRGGWPTAMAFWTAIALAVLAKGPVAIGVVGLGLMTFGLCRREFAWWREFRWKRGVLWAAALVTPWCLAVHWATDGEFLRVALGHHVIDRSLTPLEGHRGPPGFYLLSVLLLMAPWSWLLPWTVREHWGRFRADRRLAFLFGWIVGPLLLFEAVETKLVHYYLPAYPALALLIASALLGQFGSASIGLRRFDRRIGRALTVVGLGVCVGASAFVLQFLPGPIALPGVVVALVAGGGLVVAGILASQRRLHRAFFVLACTSFAAMVVMGARLMPALSQQRLAVRIAERLRQRLHDYPVALWLYREPSLIYNVGEKLPVVDGMRGEPMFPESLTYASRQGRFLCPMTPSQFDSMSKDANLDLRVIETVSCWDTNGLKQREARLVEVRPSARVGQIERWKDRLRHWMPGVGELRISLADGPLTEHARLRKASASDRERR